LYNFVFHYVRQCDLCQQAKLAQDTKVGLHTATPASYPLERVFIGFMEPLVCTKRGNQAILVVMNSFSKFVAFYPMHNITSTVVCNMLEIRYITAYRVPLFQTCVGFQVKGILCFFAFDGGLRELIPHHTIPKVRLLTGLTAT
jgi:hypothetical protein